MERVQPESAWTDSGLAVVGDSRHDLGLMGIAIHPLGISLPAAFTALPRGEGVEGKGGPPRRAEKG